MDDSKVKLKEIFFHTREDIVFELIVLVGFGLGWNLYIKLSSELGEVSGWGLDHKKASYSKIESRLNWLNSYSLLTFFDFIEF
eukprot:snap_masked-scaffold_14-processed-gene-2.29-mRNA-1 protein AED:0.47 eAED:1.00 QI:0/0/0/1/1/1/3/0/82